MSGIHMEQTEAQSSWPNTLTSFMVKFQSYMVITFALAVDNHACLISLNAFLLNLSGRGCQQGEMQSTYPRSLHFFFFFTFLFIYLVQVCVCRRAYVAVRGQLVTAEFSPSITWVPGIDLRWSGVVTSSLTCYRAISRAPFPSI